MWCAGYFAWRRYQKWQADKKQTEYITKASIMHFQIISLMVLAYEPYGCLSSRLYMHFSLESCTWFETLPENAVLQQRLGDQAAQPVRATD